MKSFISSCPSAPRGESEPVNPSDGRNKQSCRARSPFSTFHFIGTNAVIIDGAKTKKLENKEREREREIQQISFKSDVECCVERDTISFSRQILQRSFPKPDIQSSPEAPATSAPSLHLCNPRARPLVLSASVRGRKDYSWRFTSTEVQIAPSSVPPSPADRRFVELLQQRSKKKERKKKSPLSKTHTTDALYGTCARLASPYGQVITMTN